MALEILTETEAKAERLHLQDRLAFDDAVAAVAAGRPAFWSRHSSNHAGYTNAAPLANRFSLSNACLYLKARARPDMYTLTAWIGGFLDKLVPANAAAVEAISAARAQWCQE